MSNLVLTRCPSNVLHVRGWEKLCRVLTPALRVNQDLSLSLPSGHRNGGRLIEQNRSISTATSTLDSIRAKIPAQKEYQKLLEEGGIKESLEEIKKGASDNKVVITIPTHLEKRLHRRMERESTKRAQFEKMRRESRQGDKTRVKIRCKRPEFNHYHGQTYPRDKEVPLASKSWHHRKSASNEDFFTLFPGFREAPFHMSDPFMTFADLGICEPLCENLRKMSITTPTQIQLFGIPKLLNGSRTRTIIAAETGCGKTIAYLLPILNHLVRNRQRYRIRQKPGHPSVIILSPSRELADQIYNVAQELSQNLDINIKLIQGGSLGSKLKNPPTTQLIDVLVATTNALKVLSAAGVYGIGSVDHVVLDEADTLLDDSFFPDLVGPFLNRFQWNEIGNDLQLTLVSATFPSGIEDTLGQMMNVKDFHTCSTPGLHALLPHVPQTFLRLKKGQKHIKIKEILEKDVKSGTPVIIFCNRSNTCDWLSHYLNDSGIDCVAVHGRMPLKFRVGRMDLYKTGEINVLIATDLASRGIDTVRTQHVINYEFPLHIADYVHRCGRTGRVGSAGACRVTNFITRQGELKTVQEIELSVRREKNIEKVDANIRKLFTQHYGEFREILPIQEKNENESKNEAAAAT